MPVERLGCPRVGPVAGRLRPSLMSMIRLRRTAREIVRRVPGLLRRGAGGGLQALCTAASQLPTAVACRGYSCHLAERPARLAAARRHALPGGLSVRLLPGKAASPPAPAPGGKPPPAETEPLRPVPCPGAPAGHPAPRVAGPRQFFLAAISLERRDAKAAAETREQGRPPTGGPGAGARGAPVFPDVTRTDVEVYFYKNIPHRLPKSL